MKTTVEAKNASFQLQEAGQSPWLDTISRELIRSGRLAALVRDAGVLGVTSNPTIFHQAISHKEGGYGREIQRLCRRGATTRDIYDAVTMADIRDACRVLTPVYDRSEAEHGYVSLEVSPDLAHQTQRTVDEARRLFRVVGKPNVMIKVPATEEGMPAIRQLIAEGINVNATLIFFRSQYRAVYQAYMDGLQDRLDAGGDIGRVRSVASVFVSRFDNTIDKKLEDLIRHEAEEDEKEDLERLKGKAAIANSKMIYRLFETMTASDVFQGLARRGAKVQKVLWGSTSVKNPRYPDLMYVENLVGPETVNTMPLATLEAVVDHGRIVGGTVRQGLEEAEEYVRRLENWGIDLEDLGGKLLQEGLKSFVDSFDALMVTIERIREESTAKSRLPRTYYFVGPYEKACDEQTALARAQNWHGRFFAADPTLWKSDESHRKVIANRLGWLGICDRMLGNLYELDELVGEADRDGIKAVVLLGMGGSSLAPEVMSMIGERIASRRRFYVVDTTDPGSILGLTRKLDFKNTLFLVSSKSGSTVETLSQYHYFYEGVSKIYRRVKDRTARTGWHFVAVTDEGSRLEQEGYQKQFRRVFINPSDIGGRYSALSYFGMVPAALMGVDVRALLKNAREFM